MGLIVNGATSGRDLAAQMRAQRRPAAAETTRLLWECQGASGGVVNTGSEGSAGDLTPGSTMVHGARALASKLGVGIGCDGTSDGGATGAAGLNPADLTTKITAWAVVAVDAWPGGLVPILCRNAHASWASPWRTLSLLLGSGGLVQVELETTDGHYAPYMFGVASLGQILLGMTYDGAHVALWLDGVKLTQASASGDINLLSDGAWNLGTQGDGTTFTGAILRAGVEAVAWDADDWAAFTQRIRGDWVG